MIINRLVTFRAFWSCDRRSVDYSSSVRAPSTPSNFESGQSPIPLEVSARFTSPFRERDNREDYLKWHTPLDCSWRPAISWKAPAIPSRWLRDPLGETFRSFKTFETNDLFDLRAANNCPAAIHSSLECKYDYHRYLGTSQVLIILIKNMCQTPRYGYKAMKESAQRI